jgi:hypothetical protein
MSLATKVDLERCFATIEPQISAGVMRYVDARLARRRIDGFADEYRLQRRELALGGVTASEYIRGRCEAEGVPADNVQELYLAGLDDELPVPLHPLVPIEGFGEALFI